MDEVGDVGFAQLVLDGTDFAGFLERWGRVQEDAPRDTTCFLITGRARAGQPLLVHLLAAVDAADSATIVERLQPFADLGPLLDQNVVLSSYAALMGNASSSAHDGQGEPVARSGLIDHLTPEFAAAVAELLASGVVYFFNIRAVGGAVADVPADATAYAGRAANFSVTAFGADRQRMDELWDRLRPHFSGLYLSFDSDLRADRLTEAFPPATLERLRAIKSRYDPDNVFRDNFNITPARSG